MLYSYSTICLRTIIMVELALETTGISGHQSNLRLIVLQTPDINHGTHQYNKTSYI